MFHLQTLSPLGVLVLVGIVVVALGILVWSLIERSRKRRRRARARRRGRAFASYSRFWNQVMLRKTSGRLTDQRQNED